MSRIFGDLTVYHLAYPDSVRNLGGNSYCYFSENYVDARCLKITEEIWFNITSEARYVDILSGQKWAKNANIGQTVLPDRSVLIGQKLVENAKIVKFLWDFWGSFSNTVAVMILHTLYIKSTKCNCVSRLVFSHCYYSLIFFSCNLIITF